MTFTETSSVVVPNIVQGRKYVIHVAGTFGGGNLTISESLASDGSNPIAITGFSAISAGKTGNFIATGTYFVVDLASATGANLKVEIVLCPLGV